jgi:hypothetical protein
MNSITRITSAGDVSGDTCSRDGALRLAAAITRYWQSKGRRVAPIVERGGREGDDFRPWIVRLPPMRVPVPGQAAPPPRLTAGQCTRSKPWAGHNARLLARSIPVVGGGRAPAIATSAGPTVRLPRGWGTGPLNRMGAQQ